MNIDPNRQSLEPLVSNLITNVRTLRLSVTELFSTLADNGPEQESRQHQQSQSGLEEHLMLVGSNHHVNCRLSSPHIRTIKQHDKQSHQDLIQFVSESISRIYSIIKTLDEGVEALTGSQLNITLGESAHLGHDLVSERNNLYIDMCKTLKMFDNMYEYSALCTQLLQQQSLKRSCYFGYLTKEGTDYRFQRRSLFNPYTNLHPLNKTPIGRPAENIKDQIMAFADQHPTMDIFYSTPFGTSTGIFQLSLNKILKAVLILRGRLLDGLIVKAYHESFAVVEPQKHTNKSDAKASNVIQQQQLKIKNSLEPTTSTHTDFVDLDSEVDIWSESKYLVFRKITQQANIAMLHFQYPQNPPFALKMFLNWMNSYSNLFSASCTKCNTRLRNFLPPICREYRSGFEPHHESCR